MDFDYNGIMSVLKADRSSAQRADELSSVAEVLGVFVSFGSPRVIAVALGITGIGRGALGGIGWFDLALVGVVAALAGPVEWIIHRTLLHAPEDSIRMRRLQTGTGHREHHLDPLDVGWALLAWSDALVFAVMLSLFSAVWTVPLAAIFGVAIVPAWATATFASIVALGHYEWTHLLIHTRYRPKTRLYRRLAKNHRLHHYRNEHYWLGVTSNMGDRAFQTLPKAKTDVPLSETARNLDG